VPQSRCEVIDHPHHAERDPANAKAREEVQDVRRRLDRAGVFGEARHQREGGRRNRLRLSTRIAAKDGAGTRPLLRCDLVEEICTSFQYAITSSAVVIFLVPRVSTHLVLRYVTMYRS
jgi:hypothetical protein